MLRRFRRATAAAILLGLPACQAGSLAPSGSLGPAHPSWRAANRTQDAHLYVSVATESHYPSIERFRLTKGIPAAKPDRVYAGFGGLIAVASNGTLFVTTPSNVIDVFGPHDSTPARQITLPNLTRRCRLVSGSSVLDGLAADRNGYLFVAFFTYNGATAKVGGAAPNFRWPCAGVVVYAPGASGKAQPVQAISQDATPIAVAVDGSDDAYVADSQPAPLVDEFANAIPHPHKTRVFQSGYTGYVHAVATGRNGDLFIASTDSSYESGSIERYATDANGSGAPTSTISLPAGVQLLPGIAARERVLYVDNNYSSVDLYEADKNGSQSPFYSLPLSNVSSIAVGP